MACNTSLLILLLIIGGWNLSVSAQDEAQFPIVEDESPAQDNGAQQERSPPIGWPTQEDYEAPEEGSPPLGWPTQEDYEDNEDEEYSIGDAHATRYRTQKEHVEEIVTSEDGAHRHVHCSYNCPSNGNTSPSSCTVESLYNKKKRNRGGVEVSAPVPHSCSNKIVALREPGKNVKSAFARSNFIFPQTERAKLDKFFVIFYDHAMFPYEYEVTLGEEVQYWQYAVNVTVDACDFYIQENSPFMMEVASSPYRKNETDTAYCADFHHTESCCEDPDLLVTYPCVQIDCSPEGQASKFILPEKTQNEEIRDLKEMIVDMQVENDYTKYQISLVEDEIDIMKNKRKQQLYNNDVLIGNFSANEPETLRSLTRRIIQLFQDIGMTNLNADHISLCSRLKHDSDGNPIYDTPPPVLVRFALQKHKRFVLGHAVDLYSRGFSIKPRRTTETQMLVTSAMLFAGAHESSFRGVKKMGGDIYLVRELTGELVLIETEYDLEKLRQQYAN